MTKVVAVTGAIGFIGSHLVEALVQRGYYVYGIDNETYASNTHLLDTWRGFSDIFKYQKADICTLDHLPDVDAIINLAAETHVDNSLADASRFVRTNFSGVHNLLELARGKRAYQIPLFIQISTDEVYGSVCDGETAEDAPLAPGSPYAASKAAADLLVAAYGHSFRQPYRIIRPSNCYGSRQHHEKLIPKAIRHLKLGRKIPIHDTGSPTRYWLNVKDCAQAIITVLEKGTNGEIYNIGGDTEMSVKQIVTRICAEFGAKPEDSVDYTFTRQGLDSRYHVSDVKLRALGWTPSGNLVQDLPQLVATERASFRW